MKMCRAGALGLFLALVVGCGGTDEEGGVTPEDHPGLGAPRSGDVGQGYDSISRSIKPMYCIQPSAGSKWTEVGSPSATLSMTLQSDRVKVAQSMGLEVQASYGISSAAASFYRETETDDFSVSYIFGGTISFKSLQVGPNYEVNPLLAKTDVVEWHQLCGDSYIHSISRGAALYTALNFRFSSRSDKQTFETKFKTAGGLSASAALKKAQEASTENVRVGVTAVQVGGDVSQLSRALAGADAASCSMGDIQTCLGFLETLERYASTTFPNEFRDTGGRPLTGTALDAVTATVGYETDVWTSLAIPTLPNLSGKPEAKQLLGLYLQEFATQARIDAIKGMPILPRRGQAMANKQRPVLDADSLKVTRNVGHLNQAWGACYPSVTGGCTAAVDTAIASLETLDPENLEPWFDMQYPDGTAGHPLDLVDVRGDGHQDLCFDREGLTTITCLMGVGGGFEEKPSKAIDHAQRILARKPYAWIKLGGATLDLAYCAPPNVSDPMLHCIPVVDGSLTGTILFVWFKQNGGVDIRTKLDVTGIDGKAVFAKAASVINGRWNNTWSGAK